MVVCPADHGMQADIIFVVESTAINGAYINDLKLNYIIPALEYFNQGNIDETPYLSENANSLYGIVIYQTSDCLPHPLTDTVGPFTSSEKFKAAFERLEYVMLQKGNSKIIPFISRLIGGKSESHAHIAEGLATALHCFEELKLKRDVNTSTQKHCILICNSPPYLLPVMESQQYSGKTAEQLAVILDEAGGDLGISQTKNYAKDPRHLVLLRGFSLKERPLSPPPGVVTSNPNQLSATASMPSLPSPQVDTDSPITVATSQTNQNLLVPNNPVQTGLQTMQNQVFRANVTNPQELCQFPGITHANQIGGMVNQGRVMNPQFANQQLPAPPSYHQPTPGIPARNQPRWGVMPQRPPYMPPQQAATTQNSTLIAQLTQPPSSMQAAGAPTQQNQQLSNPQNIWHGLLEWMEKPKNPNDPQKITKQVPCHVSTNPSKDGELELKADGWPPKLLMQLMPKQLIGNIGGAYLKNSKSVLFHPQNCEALESLTKVMSTGFAGCVHFSSPANNAACDIKVLILLYTTEKRAYLGFIPNDQVAFVDRLRKVIQQQKNIQMPRPTAGPNLNPQGGGNVPMNATPNQMQGPNTSTSQSTQQGLMISQTNAMTMGGGQITQNVVPSTGQGGGNMGVLGQTVPAGAMQPRIRMPGMPQGGGQLNQPGAGNTNTMAGGMLGAPVQRAPFENQLQVERQQNLEKINQLKQTLEAAQQQEQQYKNQLERISHMKTSQLQEALQIAQQTEMQYKILDVRTAQQRMANQGNPQGGNVNSSRMMRPVMANNQLRHLLQQQPQYRQQLMGMQQICSGPRPSMGQQMQGGGNNPQVPFDDSNFDSMF
ncbi:mediator of rna polymerase ii transcription subunit 25 [Holotrichia oblita]|uniref:Mediator of rna polymerase ii transcription subunit 25 n=1 Tax=Holotrichia oblita TaxID=644536 RepID=A0ACB9T7D2_HOLOL|nr:mediator of rna polymerase ii transcription subunit 25 [Holotrichia oblita]